MAKILAEALAKAGIINPSEARKLDIRDQAAFAIEEGRIKRQPRILDCHGIPIIAGNDEDFFPIK